MVNTLSRLGTWVKAHPWRRNAIAAVCEDTGEHLTAAGFGPEATIEDLYNTQIGYR
ncbi:MAG: hypothetical protein LBG11_08050 [Bifidobacteriaceae bacterium]|nr:hypothetical protein [Bifidobacteriaceae bacterium]